MINTGILQKGLTLDIITDSKHRKSDTVFYDCSALGHNATSVNSPSFDTDKYGAMDFSIIDDDFLVTENFNEKNVSYDKMSAVVITKLDVTSTQGLFAKYDYSINERAWLIGMSSRSAKYRPTFYLSDDGYWHTGHRKQYACNLVDINQDGVYHAVGFTFNQGVLKIYVDGIEITDLYKAYDDAITTIHNGSSGLSIGASLDSGAYNNGMRGNIYRSMTWNRVLSDEEMQLVADSMNKLNKKSLYKGVGLAIKLSSKYMNSSTEFYNRSALETYGKSANAVSFVNDEDGKSNSAMFFTASSSDAVLVPDFLETSADMSELSVFIRAKCSNITGQSSFIGHYDYTLNKRAWFLGFILPTGHTVPKLSVTVTSLGSWGAGVKQMYADLGSNTVYNDNEWHIIGFTFKSNSLKLYVDGSQITDVTYPYNNTVNTIYDSNTGVSIGSILSSGNPAFELDGTISECFTWNRELSADEIGEIPSFFKNNIKLS